MAHIVTIQMEKIKLSIMWNNPKQSKLVTSAAIV